MMSSAKSHGSGGACLYTFRSFIVKLPDETLEQGGACLYTFRSFIVKLPDETLEQGRNASQSAHNTKLSFPNLLRL